MPIYEYQCTSCHHHFDLMQKINDEPAKECPECHQNTAIKLISAAGFQLKGTGWYATDFKNKNNPPKATNTKTESEQTAETSTKPATEPTKSKEGSSS